MSGDDDLLMDLFAEASIKALASDASVMVDATHATKLLEFQSGSTSLRALSVFKFDPADPPVVVTVRDGRTIDLPNKEFARVDISLSATGPRSTRDAVYAGLAKLSIDMLTRELDGITKPSKEVTPIANIPLPDTLESVQYISLGLTYGLTINLGNYNFRKPTVAITESFHPSDFHVAWAGMVSWLMPNIQGQVKKARAKSDVGNIGL